LKSKICFVRVKGVYLSLEGVGLLAAMLIVSSQLAVYIAHSLLLSGCRKKHVEPIGRAGESRNVSFIVPVRKEPLEYVENAVRYVGSLGIPGYEVVIVSDDDVDVRDELFELVKRLREEGLNVWIMWRSVPRGFRTGALNDGLYLSTGDYVYVLDVDTRPERCFFDYAISVLKSNPDCVAVTGRWEPLNADTRVSEALALGLRFLTRVLYRARSCVGLFPYPLGTGTLYNARLLKELLGGWDENRIQDDMELGARIMYSGLKIKYLDECAIRVENPGTYRGFRIQQSRWAYGALDAAIARFKYIFKSKYPLHVKVEALLYLLQYIPQFLVFGGTLILSLVLLVAPRDYMAMIVPLLAVWIASLPVYIYFMFKEGFWERSLWKFAVLSGRLSAISTAVSPYVTVSSLKAVFRVREVYKRTPKGVYQKTFTSLRIPWELLLGLLYCGIGLYALIEGLVISAAWLIISSAGYLYVVYRFSRDVFYK